MAQRHKDAVMIQQGACNLSGIARSLVAACDEARADRVSPTEDVACRLIVHQMASISNTWLIDNEPDSYSKLMTECEQKAAE